MDSPHGYETQNLGSWVPLTASRGFLHEFTSEDSVFFCDQICDPPRTVNGVTEANENTTHSAGDGLPARVPGSTRQPLSGFTSTRA